MERFIAIQQDDFNVQAEYDALCKSNSTDGAVVFFVGRVRDTNVGDDVVKMVLEHYPAMTESVLNDIVVEAGKRWQLSRVRVIHRYGPLSPSDQIVFVATSSPHRESAFLGAQFIMDFLKTQAPFWKKETTSEGERWVEAKADDEEKAFSWEKP